MKPRNLPPRPDSRYGLAVRVLLKNGNGEVLLLQRSPASSTNPERWELPGGKVDDGERFDEALHREVHEETGLEIALDGPLGTVEQRLAGIRAVHLIMGGEIIGGELSISDEHMAFAWITPARFLDLNLADWFKDYIEQNPHLFAEALQESQP